MLDKFDEASNALKAKLYDKVKAALDSGTEVVSKRIKVIKMADKSDFGWSMVNEYLWDELASNSDDKKKDVQGGEKGSEKNQGKMSSFPPRGSKGIGIFYFCRFFFPFRTFLFSGWSA